MRFGPGRWVWYSVGPWAENSEMSLLEPEDSRWKRGKRSELKQEQRTLGVPPAVVVETAVGRREDAYQSE